MDADDLPLSSFSSSGQKKKHKCSQCPRSFSYYYLLTKHVQNHHEDPSCPECGRQFPDRASRAKHIREAHPDREQPQGSLSRKTSFPCDLCGKSFTRAAERSNHFMRWVCGNTA